MNRRERMERCYSGRETDRPAVYSRTGFPGDDPSYERLKAFIAANTELKAGWSGVTQSGYDTETYTESYSDSFQRRVSILHTPAGDLRSSTLISLRGQPPLDETYYIGNREDALKYLSLPMPQVLEVDVQSLAEARKRVGDAGIVESGLGFCPGGRAASLLGTENFALMSLSDRDVIHEICRRELAICINRLKALLDAGAGPFFSMAGEEYIVPPIHGPVDFRDFIVRYDRPIIDLVHDSGGCVHIHCHGSVGKVLPDFIDMGVDVMHPFEAPPMGDITAREAKALIRGQMCFEGNIQISRMYEAGPEDIRLETEHLLADVFDDSKGLIVSPTASPYIRGKGLECFPQYKAMIDAVLGV